MIKKFLLLFVVGFLGLLIVVSIVVGASLGPIVKLGMEQVGPRVTQTSINVGQVDIGILTGSATLRNLLVGNPQGYSSSESFKVGTVTVKMAPMSVISPKILIYSVHVESPEITFEGGLRKNNLNQILANVNDFTKGVVPASSGASSNASAESKNGQASKIEVDDFLITGTKVHVHLSGVISQDIPIPDIHLTDLGKNGQGLTPSELTSAIIKSIIRGTLSAITGSVTNLSSGVEGIGKTAFSTVGDGVSKITSSLGGIWGH